MSELFAIRPYLEWFVAVMWTVQTTTNIASPTAAVKRVTGAALFFTPRCRTRSVRKLASYQNLFQSHIALTINTAYQPDPFTLTQCALFNAAPAVTFSGGMLCARLWDSMTIIIGVRGYSYGQYSQ